MESEFELFWRMLVVSKMLFIYVKWKGVGYFKGML